MKRPEYQRFVPVGRLEAAKSNNQRVFARERSLGAYCLAATGPVHGAHAYLTERKRL